MDLLSRKLGIEELPSKSFELVKNTEPEETKLVPVKDIPDQQDIKEDYQLARKTFRDIISKGNNVLNNLESISKEAETAREAARIAEVMSALMKTVSDTAKDMFLLQKVTKDLKDEPNKKQETGNMNIDKAVFVGTTADLLKKIKAEDN